MLHKEIKTKAQAAKVARALAKDLREKLAIYNSYNVYVEESSSQYDVTVTSPEGCCNILTCPCIDDMMDIVKMYVLQYERVSYHMGVAKKGDMAIPAFIICIGYQEEKKQ